MRQVTETRSMRRTRMRRGTLEYPPKHPTGFALVDADHPTKGWGKRYASRCGKKSNRS